MGGALVGLVILSAACNDQIVKGCFTSANPAAQQADLAIEIGLPRQCHLTIANPGNAVTLIAMLTAAPVEFYNGRVTAHQMFAFHNGVWVEVSSPPFQLQWISAVECGSRACVPVDAQWSAATGTSQNGIYKDRWQATGATTHGDGVVFTDFTGTAGAAAGIGGTAAPVGGMVNSWTTLVTWAAPLPADTLSFEYQWLLDGSPVATTRTYSRVFNEESGTQHTLKSIVTLMDGTKDTVSKVVTVALAASVSGPSELDPDEVGAWQAVMRGARYPLTSCEWWIDTTPVPGSSCTLEYSWSTPSSSYVLSVVATDSRGYSATSIGHGIHIGAANCSPPDCYESMRGGAHTRRIAPRQKRPR